MSDRIPLWEHLTSVVMREAPITGLGYYAASRVVATEYNPGLGNAHSVFFEVLVGGGVLGAALYLGAVCVVGLVCRAPVTVASGQPSAVAAAGLLSAALLMGITSQSALHAGPLGFAFWSLTALLPELSREAARARIAGQQRLTRRPKTGSNGECRPCQMGREALCRPRGTRWSGENCRRACLARPAPGPAAYFHFLPPLRGPLPRSPGPASTPPPKAAPGGWPVLGWIRLIRNAARCWVGYLRTVRPALKRSWLVIGDRWMYGYVVQPDALKFQGPDSLARAVLRLLPRPHLIVNLAAPPHVIRERKQELTLSQIEQELLAWSSLRRR